MVNHNWLQCNHPLRLIILALVAACTVSWKNVPLRRAAVKGNNEIAEYLNHSEYRFGYCEDESQLLYINKSMIPAKDTYMRRLLTVYEQVDYIPNCTVILMKSPPSQYALSMRLPMQLCYSRITFIAHDYINITMMLDITFFNELAIPMEMHLYYYRLKRFRS